MTKAEHEFFPVADVDWTPALGGKVAGLYERILVSDPDTGVATRILRFDPGTDTSVAGVQTHPFWEEVYILEGSLHDLILNQTFPKGAYACRPPGMPHGPWLAPEGCLTFEVRYASGRPASTHDEQPEKAVFTPITVEIMETDGTKNTWTPKLENVLLMGYTGRDRANVMEHIHELEALGIPPPPQVPMVYTVGAELLTCASQITVNNPDTSGEAEVYMLSSWEGQFIGLGSDHTDRKQEAIDIAVSKGLCPKIVSSQVWRQEDIEDHWDRLELRSWMTDRQGRRLYQEGRLDTFLSYDDLVQELLSAPRGNIMQQLIFCGTMPTIGGLTCGSHFDAELRDPVLGRSLTIGYDVVQPE